MSISDLWKTASRDGQVSLEAKLGNFLREYLVVSSSPASIPKIQNLCNTLGYHFIRTVHGSCGETDSSDYKYILDYALKGEGWKIISCILWNKLEGLICVTELCTVISSLFPICLSKIGPNHSLVNPHLPLITVTKVETCFQSPKKIRQRQQRIRKAREKERGNSSDSEGTNTKKSNLRIHFDRRDFEYFNRNMKSEDSLSDSENEDKNLSSVAAKRGNAVLNEEISAYEMCDILLETAILAIMNEKQKKVKNYNLPLLCLNFSSSQLLLWEFQNASEGSCNLHIKLLKLFYTCCDMLCHNSDIFECLFQSGKLQKHIDMVFLVTEFLEELNFKHLVVDTVCDGRQPVIIEKLQIFTSDCIIGLFLTLEKIINSKYAGGNVRKFIDNVHDIFPRSMDVLERLLKADYMEKNTESFERLLKASTNFISTLKKYRDNFVHSQLCPKSLHKNCTILTSHHHDIFGQQIRALKLGNSNSCVVSWCATALLSVFDKCDEVWGGKVLNALRSCGLCCCLETKAVFENVIRKIHETKAEGFGYFRFLLFLARETGLCCDPNQTCISCKVNGGLMTPILECEATDKKVSFAERYSFFQLYYDLVLESNDSLLLALLEHLKQFSQEASQGVKQGLILRVIFPSLSHFKTLYVNSGMYESILELLLQILAVALNYDIIQNEEIDSHVFNRICDLLLRPQFSKSCARILHLATLLEVKKVDFENSSKPYTELLLAISDFHITKLIETFEHEDVSIFFYELSGDGLKIGSEDIGYNSDYEKQDTKIKSKFGAIPQEDSATESAITPSDRELSERESQPEQEEAEKKALPLLYPEPDAIHLTVTDHLRVAGAVWEALVLSMLYSPRLLDVVRIRPIMKKVLKLVGCLLSHILKTEETDDFGLFESFLVSIQICGPFHVFPATSENPEDITKVLIQCLSSEVPVQFTTFLVNSFLSASVLKKFIPHPRVLWNEKRSDFDDCISESLSDNDVCSNSEGYEADTEPCEAYRHAKYVKQIKSSNFEDLNVVFPSLLKYMCEIFASQIPIFCKLLDKRIEDQCRNTAQNLNMENFNVGEYNELSSFFQLVVITINRVCGFCRKSPLNTELLSKEELIKIAIISFRPILLNNYKELTEPRVAILELITLLGARKLDTEELSLYLECFKTENPPMMELITPLIQLAATAPQPTSYLCFPARRILPNERSATFPTLLQTNKDAKSVLSLSFSTPGIFNNTETSPNTGKQITAHHIMKGIVSAWESSALQVPLLSDHTWSPRNQGFSAAIWFYVKADACRGDIRNTEAERNMTLSQTKSSKVDWREASMIFGKYGGYIIDYTNSEAGQSPIISETTRDFYDDSADIHFFSLGSAGWLVEFWIRPDRGRIVAKVSEATKTSYNVVATDSCQLPFMTRAWHHLAVNCREIVGFRKHSVEIEFFLDGIVTNKLLIDLKKPLNRHYDRTCLLIGQTCVDVPNDLGLPCDPFACSWFFGNAFIFKLPVFNRENALLLYSLGPDFIDLAECDIDAIKMSSLNLVSEKAVQALLNWDILLDGKHSCLHTLQEQLFLSYRSDSVNSALVYPTVITPFSGSYSAFFSRPIESFAVFSTDKRSSQQPPIEVPVSLSAELRPLACTHVTSSVRRLGGLSVLLFLFARVVEKSDDEVLHASVLSLLLNYMRSSSCLQLEFVCLDGRVMLQHLLMSNKFKSGFHTLKVFLDLCSETPLLFHNPPLNELKLIKKNRTVLTNFNLLAFTLTLWELWIEKGQTLASPDSPLALLLSALLQSVKEETKYSEFNCYMLNKIRILELLLTLIKENTLVSFKVDMCPEICDTILELIRNVCIMPPKVDDLICIRDFIILAHPSSQTFINQTPSKFFFVLPPSDTGNFFSSGMKSAVSRTGKEGQSKSDRTSSHAEIEVVEQDSSKKNFTHPVDPQTLSKALSNLQVKWNADNPSTQNSSFSLTSQTLPRSSSQPLEVISISKSSTEMDSSIKADPSSYSAFNHEMSMEAERPLEKGEEAFLLDDWEHITVKHLESSSSEGTSQPEIIVTSEKIAIPWEVYTHNNSQSNMIDGDAMPNKFKTALETPSIISFVEGLLMFVRDSLKVLPDAMIANVIDHVIMPELLVILCQNPDPGIKVSVLKVLDIILQRVNEEQLLKFVKLNGFFLLGNQLGLFPATVEVVEMCLSIIIGQSFSFENNQDVATLLPQELALYQISALPLALSCLKASVEDTALFHNLIEIIRDIMIKMPVILTALVDFGLIECAVTCLHSVSYLAPNETDVVGQREEEILIDDLVRLLSTVAVRLVSTTGINSFQVLQDILHQLNYLEQGDRQKLGLAGLFVYRRAQCWVLKESIVTLEGLLSEAQYSRRPSPVYEMLVSQESTSRDSRKPQPTSYLSLFLNTPLHAHYKQFSRRLSLEKQVFFAEATERFKWLIIRSVDYIICSEVSEKGYMFSGSEKSFVKYLSSLLITSMDVGLGKGRNDNWCTMLRCQRDMLRVQFGRLLGFLLSPLQEKEIRSFIIKELADRKRYDEILRLAAISSVATEQSINQNMDDFLTNHFSTLEEPFQESCLKILQVLQCLGTVHSSISNGNGWSSVGWGPRSLPTTPGEGTGEVLSCSEYLSRAKYSRAKWLQQLEAAELRARKITEPISHRACDSAISVTREVVELQNSERRNVVQSTRAKAANLADAPRLWKLLADRMLHEHATWYMSEYFPQHWEMDPREGPDRVRIRLQRCFLDIGDRYILPESRRKKKEPRCIFEYLMSPIDKNLGNSVDRISAFDVIRFSSPSMRILPLGEVNGEILIGRSDIYFVANDGEGENWPLGEIRSVYRRRYELKDQAVELFLTSSTTLFITFELNSDRESFLKELSNANLPSLATGEENLQEMTMLWKEGLITNFSYLMNLNTLAGRSYNDLMQYPVVPFVLADYSSSCLDLTNQSSYRNLKKPVGIQDPNNERHYIHNYNYLKNEYQNAASDDLIKVPYHYGSHYSNSGIVLHFLVRLLPFTKLFLFYQDRNFDIPDRTFHNLGATWRLASAESTTDVKEMIPESFFLPEFLVNMNGFDFGLRQSGERVDHVTLPPWSMGNDPRRFILLHRQALESDIVRENLNHWIDLIFGFKQQGQAAIEALNVFHPATYFGFDVNSAPDPIERKARYTMIKTYGQTPKQLFASPHPVSYSKSPRENDTQLLPLGGTALGIKWGNFVGANGQGEPSLVWKQVHPVRGVWLCPVATGEIFGIPPKCSLVANCSKEKTTRGQIAFLVQSAAVLNWSHPDGLLRLRSRKDVPARPVIKPPVDDTVVACANSINSDMVWVGYASGIVEVHHYNVDVQKGDLSIRKSSVIVGNHRSPIVSISLCKEFGVAVTGSMDRTILIWDLQRLSYIRSLETSDQDDDTIGTPTLTHTCISSTLGDIVITSKLNQMESSLDLFTINGSFVAHARTPVVTCICYSSAPEGISVNLIVTGHQSGDIRFWNSWDLSPIRKLTEVVKKPVTSLVYTKDCNSLVASFQDGTICVWEKKGSKKYSWAPRAINLSLI